MADEFLDRFSLEKVLESEESRSALVEEGLQELKQALITNDAKAVQECCFLLDMYSYQQEHIDALIVKLVDLARLPEVCPSKELDSLVLTVGLLFNLSTNEVTLPNAR